MHTHDASYNLPPARRAEDNKYSLNTGIYIYKISHRYFSAGVIMT